MDGEEFGREDLPPKDDVAREKVPTRTPGLFSSGPSPRLFRFGVKLHHVWARPHHSRQVPLGHSGDLASLHLQLQTTGIH